MNAKSQILARGVSSGARLRDTPAVFSHAQGSTVTTVDGETLDDFMLAMGPILLGHSRDEITHSLQTQLSRGVLYGTTAGEHELAEKLTTFLPWADHVAFVNTGSEATHLATRLGLVSTGRTHILKFEGHYHGWIDPLFINTQNNAPDATGSNPVTPEHSVPAMAAAPHVIVTRWNSIEQLEEVFAEHGETIGSVILEPIPMNFGTMLPDPEFAERLRTITREYGARLIFDEVLSGFRLARGGAAELLDIEPDIGVYAKSVANGMPIAVVAGTQEAMKPITEGSMLPAGTYSGNPLSVQASLATLDIIDAAGNSLYSRLEELGARLQRGIDRVAAETGKPLSVNRVGSVLQLFWGTTESVTTYESACQSDRARVSELCNAFLDGGALVTPRGLILLCAQHTEEQIDRLVDNMKRVLNTMGDNNAR